MAEIRPLNAWRYHRRLAAHIQDLTSPLFDVVSPAQKKALYRHPCNSIHLSVPAGAHPALSAKKTLKTWKARKIIVQDKLPGIYAYYQYFSLPGSDKTYCRKGFVCHIKAYDWEEKVILRHERTMPFSVKDRMDLLHETQLNVSPTHGLYTDPAREIETYLDESMTTPVYEVEDYQGVRDTMSIIHDAGVIRRIIEIIKDKQIILADGHHRYAGSLAYRKKRMQENLNHTGGEGYNYHLMYLTNTESDDLRILPTHRIATGIKTFSEKWLLDMLSSDFVIKPIENPPDVNEIILGKQWAFGLLVGDNAYKIRLKPERIDTMTWNFPKEIKELDLTVMHYFIFEKILGIPGKDQASAQNLRFERNFTECLREVIKGEAQFAVITKDISIEIVKKVCASGYTMPQKSTYFYPKVLCGFLFSSIAEDEFYSPFDPCFQ